MPTIKRRDDANDVSQTTPATPDEIIAAMWLRQVDAFDGLPQKRWPRRYVKFSPSQADACARELYFTNINAPSDKAPVVPWKERRRRNGNAYHAETQKAHKAMHVALREAGITPDFEVIAQEINGEAKFDVTLDGHAYMVIIEGRADTLIRYVGQAIDGVVASGDVFVVDYKAKAKASGVSRVKREGAPESNRLQMVAYSLLSFKTSDGTVYRDVNKAILHYESLEKPKESETETKDVLPIIIHTTTTDQRELLVKFAKVVRAVEERTPPAMEPTKCTYCAFKGVCGEVEAKKTKEAS